MSQVRFGLLALAAAVLLAALEGIDRLTAWWHRTMDALGQQFTQYPQAVGRVSWTGAAGTPPAATTAAPPAGSSSVGPPPATRASGAQQVLA